jgi:hypothetical protein
MPAALTTEEALACELGGERFAAIFGGARGNYHRPPLTSLPAEVEALLREFVRARGVSRTLDGFELRINDGDTGSALNPKAALAASGQVIAFLSGDRQCVHFRYEVVPGWKRGRLQKLISAIEAIREDEGIPLSVPQIWGVLDTGFKLLPPAPRSAPTAWR